MSNSSNIDTRRNKKIIVNNSEILKKYAWKNRENLGTGIIIINLLLIENDIIKETDLDYQPLLPDEEQKISLQKPISYLTLTNFWFKIVKLKIKKKYDIDIKKDYDLSDKFLLIFVKDADLENFSIYSIKFN